MLKFIAPLFVICFCHFSLVAGPPAGCNAQTYQKMEKDYINLAQKLEKAYKEKNMPQDTYNHYKATLDILKLSALPSYHSALSSPEKDSLECDSLTNIFNDAIKGIAQQMADPDQNVGS